VHFVKANGRLSPKVFKLKELELEPKGFGAACKDDLASPAAASSSFRVLSALL
jgi:hypothetical protein